MHIDNETHYDFNAIGMQRDNSMINLSNMLSFPSDLCASKSTHTHKFSTQPTHSPMPHTIDASTIMPKNRKATAANTDRELSQSLFNVIHLLPRAYHKLGLDQQFLDHPGYKDKSEFYFWSFLQADELDKKYQGLQAAVQGVVKTDSPGKAKGNKKSTCSNKTENKKPAARGKAKVGDQKGVAKTDSPHAKGKAGKSSKKKPAAACGKAKDGDMKSNSPVNPSDMVKHTEEKPSAERRGQRIPTKRSKSEYPFIFLAILFCSRDITESPEMSLCTDAASSKKKGKSTETSPDQGRTRKKARVTANAKETAAGKKGEDTGACSILLLRHIKMKTTHIC